MVLQQHNSITNAANMAFIGYEEAFNWLVRIFPCQKKLLYSDILLLLVSYFNRRVSRKILCRKIANVNILRGNTRFCGAPMPIKTPAQRCLFARPRPIYAPTCALCTAYINKKHFKALRIYRPPWPLAHVPQQPNAALINTALRCLLAHAITHD